jgi:hypothetical protein
VTRPAALRPDLAAARSLAAKLETLHATLDVKEQRILEHFVYVAADPLARIGMRDSAEILSADEQAQLDDLLAARQVKNGGRDEGQG